MEFTLIAGPCALEDDGLNLRIAQEVKRVGLKHGLPVIFKGSFDKANRTRLHSPRGIGFERGMEAFRTVKRETGLTTLTDIHEPWQAQRAASVVDVLQIPAFLSRQTDLIFAASKSGRQVNVKIGQWMGPEEFAPIQEKAPGCWLTYRGTSMGPGRVVSEMRWMPGLIFDATHSASGPDGSWILARAAAAAGCSGLYLEVHPDPFSAPSDGQRMLDLQSLDPLVSDVVAIRRALGA